MRTRLALVACKDATQGPWLRARGNEKSVRVQQLGRGERITLVAEHGGALKHTEYTTDGTFPLDSGWSRLRFDKHAGEECKPTVVELIVE